MRNFFAKGVDRLLRAIRERRLLLSMVLMVALVLVLALLSFSVFYQRVLGNLLTMKILRQNESML